MRRSKVLQISVCLLIARLQKPEGAKFNLRGYMEFESRRRIQDEVLEALKRDDVTMCSICGMGGIGKTTLAKNLVKKVEADGLFDKVAMVTVSQNPNLEEIQKGIIDSLELKIESSTMQGRAKKLNDWLSNHRTLLILDDVWWQIHDDDFEKVGIPSASNRCKIVFTSRNIDECKKMGSEPNFPLSVLDDGEALELFLQSAGKCVEERNLQDKARKIVDECRGLPIAIVTIAKALKDKPQGEWDDSLKKLQKSNLPGISDMEKVHSKIQVSYDLLKDSEAQSCLRLCCLFPEDYNVPVEKLVFYGKGLELFEGAERLKEARDRVDLIVHKLKSSFLLLDGEQEGCVKMHDIVRDFAMWISFKDKNPYLVICEKEMEMWPENCQYEKCSVISIACKKIKNHPVGLRCPNLKLLQLYFEDYSDLLPRAFFVGMEELRVVDLEVSSSPSLTMPEALRTLLITHYDNTGVYTSKYIREMLSQCNLMNLEIVSLTRMNLSEFPIEIGSMRNLKCLRFDSGHFQNIQPGVLSNLVQLEELELPPTFKDWGLKTNGRSNASLDEIRSLPLTSITIGLKKGSILPESIVKSIMRFRIHVECFFIVHYVDFYSNRLVVINVDACYTLVEWTSSLLRKCHELELERVGLKYIMSQQFSGNNYYQCAHFSQLKSLKIGYMNCLEEILHGTYLSNIQQSCFTNLSEIHIKKCPKLKHVFSLSMAREFTQLETVTVENCREMEEVFYDDHVDSGNQNIGESIENVDHVVVLPRLKQLYLTEMPKLRVLYKGNHTIQCPSLDQLNFVDIGGMEYLYYQSKQLTSNIRVGDLNNISKWLPFAQENGIQQIKELTITKGHEMQYLVDAIVGPNLLKTFFSSLEYLRVWDMDSLEEIWHGPYLPKIHAQCFSNLAVIWIYKCQKMKHLFPLPVATELRQLRVMKIVSCEEIEEILYKDDQVDNENENQVASIETATPTPNENEKSSVLCPTPTSFIQCLLPKGKQSKHLSHEITEENVGKGDEREVDRVIVWPRLEKIYLSEVPKLRAMYNGDHTIECPSLEVLMIDGIIGIRHLKNITEWLHFKQDNGIPPLQELRIGRCHEMINMVNAMTDRNLLKTFFSILKQLWIENMDSLEEIWHGPYLSIAQAQPCFTHLTQIIIWNCPKLKHMFPLSVATELTQLQELKIRWCEEMEEIFYQDQVAEGDQIASNAELNIQTTETASRPLYSTHQDQSMEENTTKLDEKEVDDATIFPKLEILKLVHLTKLRILYDRNHAIELPSLERMKINGCNKIETLSNGSFKAPKLKEIEINWKSYPSCEDLNTVVKKKLNKDENKDEEDEKDENEDDKDDKDEDEDDKDVN